MEFDGQVVKQGTWLYAGEVVCDVRIVKHDWRYGTGDYEDPPDVREDLQGEFYDLEFGSPVKRGEYLSGGGSHLSLAEAVSEAEAATHGTVRWDD
jgi:hypothetical protein